MVEARVVAVRMIAVSPGQLKERHRLVAVVVVVVRHMAVIPVVAVVATVLRKLLCRGRGHSERKKCRNLEQDFHREHLRWENRLDIRI